MAGQSIGLCSTLGDFCPNFASAQSALFSAGSPRVAFRETSTEPIFVDSCVLGLEGRGRGRHAHEVEHDAASKMRYAKFHMITTAVVAISDAAMGGLCTHPPRAAKKRIRETGPSEDRADRTQGAHSQPTEALAEAEDKKGLP
eukprot:scaffold105971_cov63-Phaeocystis_antarctica.AAC.6